MKQAFRAGLATAKLCLKEQSYFGFANLPAQYLLQAGGLAALLMIWRSLFLQGVDLEGMHLSQFYTYTVLSTILAPLLNIHTPASGWLHDGTMLGLYQRPAGVFAQLAAHTVGGWGMRLLCLSLPVLLISLACGLDMRPASPWFFLSLLLSVLQGLSVNPHAESGMDGTLSQRSTDRIVNRFFHSFCHSALGHRRLFAVVPVRHSGRSPVRDLYGVVGTGTSYCYTDYLERNFVASRHLLLSSFRRKDGVLWRIK